MSVKFFQLLSQENKNQEKRRALTALSPTKNRRKVPLLKFGAKAKAAALAAKNEEETIAISKDNHVTDEAQTGTPSNMSNSPLPPKVPVVIAPDGETVLGGEVVLGKSLEQWRQNKWNYNKNVRDPGTLIKAPKFGNLPTQKASIDDFQSYMSTRTIEERMAMIPRDA